MKKKEQRKDFATLGKEIYGFDLQSERNIYDYLCRFHMKKKSLHQLDNELKFNSYKQWEKYIKDRYSDYDNEILIEFSRYLNQRIRNVKSGGEYWNLCVPAVMTLALTEWMESFLSVETDLSGAPFIVTLLAVALLIAILVFFLWKIISPLLENTTEKYMLEDYKEIIDSMIEE